MAEIWYVTYDSERASGGRLVMADTQVHAIRLLIEARQLPNGFDTLTIVRVPEAEANEIRIRRISDVVV